MEEELSFVNDQLRQEKKNETNAETDIHFRGDTAPLRFKIKWKAGKSGLTEELIDHLFSKYGELEALVLGKKASAIVEYKCLQGAKKCMEAEEYLRETYDVSLKWLGPDLSCKVEAKISSEDGGEIDLEEMEREILKKLKQASSSH